MGLLMSNTVTLHVVPVACTCTAWLLAPQYTAGIHTLISAPCNSGMFPHFKKLIPHSLRSALNLGTLDDPVKRCC